LFFHFQFPFFIYFNENITTFSSENQEKDTISCSYPLKNMV